MMRTCDSRSGAYVGQVGYTVQIVRAHFEQLNLCVILFKCNLIEFVIFRMKVMYYFILYHCWFGVEAATLE